MKVLHLGKFFPPHHGGMETHLALLASGLTPFVEVEVAVAAGAQPHGREIVGNVTVHRMRTAGLLASQPICPELFTIIRQVRPDLVHLHHPNPLAMLSYLAVGTHVPCVVSYHSDIVRQRVLKYALRPLETLVYRRATRLLCCSPTYIDGSALLQRFAAKTQVLPIGINLEPWHSLRAQY